MRRLMVVELTKMRYYWVVWAAGLFALGASGIVATDSRYAYVVALHPAVEYLMFFYVTGRLFAILTILVTAYVINEDFSMGTVQNVLSAGVNAAKYYLSRLLAQMLFVLCLYLLGFGVYVAVRIFSQGEINTAMPFAELMGTFLMMGMQLMAYVAIAGAISVFCRNQAVAMAAGELWLFLALVLSAYKDSGMELLGFMDYEPLMVMRKVDVWGVSGAVFTFGYFKYAVSAAMLIAAAAAVGYLRFVRFDVYSCRQ